MMTSRPKNGAEIHPDTSGAYALALSAVLLVTVWMLVVASWGRDEVGPPAVVVVLYLAFSAATVLGVGSATRLNRFAGAAAALAISPLFVWHFREVVRLPDLKSHAPLACLGGTVFLYVVASLCVRLPLRRLVAATLISAMCFSTLLGLSYTLSPGLRWQLLKRHTVFGFPANLILGPSVREASDELWAKRVGEDSPTPVPPPSTAADGAGPTIVFIILDALRRDSLGAYGGDADLMPELNSIMQRSVVFDDVLANASWTRPSVASMFTGLHQEHHGAVGREDVLRSDVDVLADLLDRRGYETAAFIANRAVGRDAGFSRGFETFVELSSPVHPYLRADGVTREVLEWVRARGADGGAAEDPLFLFVHYLDPHVPYLSGGTDSAVFSTARNAYQKEVSFLDGQVAELLRSLETELAGPVVSIVAADHGEEFGEHRQRGHGHSLYQEVVRVPLYVRTPAEMTARVDSRLEGRDLFDLILAASVSADFDPVAWARPRDRSRRYTSEYLSSRGPFYRLQYREVCMRAVEQDGLFVIWSALGPTVEAYDRTADPLEERNLDAKIRGALPEMLDELDRLAPAPWANRVEIRHSPGTEEQLRALGYLD
jgi:arylsulfatase A-like enzyme